MKCRAAREALNNLIDGVETARAQDAREHLKGCRECRQRFEGVERMLDALAETHYDMPAMDISAAVMAQLPARHPVSAAGGRLPWRLFAWIAALWLTGLTIITVLGAVAGGWSLPGVISGVVAIGRELWGGAGYGLSGIVVVARAVAGATIHICAGLAVPASRLRGPLVLFLVMDSALLFAAYAILRGRHRAAGPFCIIA